MATLPNWIRSAIWQDKYNALVHFDDCHATGFVGKTGRGTHEHCGVIDRIDLTTGTFGKALGGASGGYTSGRAELIELLRQRSRPYLFSNTLAPAVAGGSLKAIELVQESTELRDRLEENTTYFRGELTRLDFNVLAGTHPIVPIMLGDARLASKMADRLLQLGVYVIGFSYPVVPMDQARIRVQISAAHTREDLDFCHRAVHDGSSRISVGVIPQGIGLAIIVVTIDSSPMGN